MSDAPVKIELSRDVALVLFEWLACLDEREHEGLVEAHAEQIALWKLEGLLEKSLVEIFDPACARLHAEARARLAGSDSAEET